MAYAGNWCPLRIKPMISLLPVNGRYQYEKTDESRSLLWDQILGGSSPSLRLRRQHDSTHRKTRYSKGRYSDLPHSSGNFIRKKPESLKFLLRC